MAHQVKRLTLSKQTNNNRKGYKMKDFDYMALVIKCMLLFMFARMFLFIVGVDL